MRGFSVQASIRVLLLLSVLACPQWCAAAEATSGRRISEAEQAANWPATAAYAQQIKRLIAASWARTLQKRTGFANGLVVVHVVVDRQGKAIRPHVIDGDPRTVCAEVALRAVKDARLPAMSDDVVKELKGKRLPLDLTFEPNPAPR